MPLPAPFWSRRFAQPASRVRDQALDAFDTLGTDGALIIEALQKSDEAEVIAE